MIMNGDDTMRLYYSRPDFIAKILQILQYCMCTSLTPLLDIETLSRLLVIFEGLR